MTNEERAAKNQAGITAELLRALFSYDRDTGIVTRRVTVSTTAVAGAVVGTRVSKGHLSVKIKGRHFGLHRVIWVLVTGEWPPFEVDHLDGCSWNNRWPNLRLATSAVNTQNRRRPNRNNRVGLLGVSRNGSGFSAEITIGKTRRHLGTFPTKEQAHMAYVEAKRQMHPGCTI